MTKVIKVSEKGRLTREMMDAQFKAQLSHHMTEEEKDALAKAISQFQVAPEDALTQKSVQCQTPQHAAYLLYFFLPKKNRDTLLGDLEEEYKEVHTRFGNRLANIWFWKQVLMSLYPLWNSWLARYGTKLGEWSKGIVAEAIKRKIG